MMGQEGERGVKRTHSLFLDDVKVYQENHQKPEFLNEIIVKASMDTGACYGVKKCAEIVFKKGKMVKGIGLAVLEKKMKHWTQAEMKTTNSWDVSKRKDQREKGDGKGGE